jgi:hypothetical protein
MGRTWLFAGSNHFAAAILIAPFLFYVGPVRAQSIVRASPDLAPSAVESSASPTRVVTDSAPSVESALSPPPSASADREIASGAHTQTAAATIGGSSSAATPSVDRVAITHATGLIPPRTGSITEQVKAILSKLPAVQRLKFQRASAAFPSFCQGWERKLRDREVDNLAHLNWQARDGFKNATYVGYGRVESCETKASSVGVPIGKLTYEEYRYYLAGKSVNEARHAQPKLIGASSTLEIFSWDKNRWFY